MQGVPFHPEKYIDHYINQLLFLIVLLLQIFFLLFLDKKSNDSPIFIGKVEHLFIINVHY